MQSAFGTFVVVGLMASALPQCQREYDAALKKESAASADEVELQGLQFFKYQNKDIRISGKIYQVTTETLSQRPTMEIRFYKTVHVDRSNLDHTELGCVER